MLQDVGLPLRMAFYERVEVKEVAKGIEFPFVADRGHVRIPQELPACPHVREAPQLARQEMLPEGLGFLGFVVQAEPIVLEHPRGLRKEKVDSFPGFPRRNAVPPGTWARLTSEF